MLCTMAVDQRRFAGVKRQHTSPTNKSTAEESIRCKSPNKAILAEFYRQRLSIANSPRNRCGQSRFSDWAHCSGDGSAGRLGLDESIALRQANWSRNCCLWRGCWLQEQAVHDQDEDEDMPGYKLSKPKRTRSGEDLCVTSGMMPIRHCQAAVRLWNSSRSLILLGDWDFWTLIF